MSEFEFNTVESLLSVLNDTDLEKHVLPARLDGNTEVTVIVSEIPTLWGEAFGIEQSRGVIPVAVLFTDNIFQRVTPATPGMTPETAEAADERVRNILGSESA